MSDFIPWRRSKEPTDSVSETEAVPPPDPDHGAAIHAEPPSREAGSSAATGSDQVDDEPESQRTPLEGDEAPEQAATDAAPVSVSPDSAGTDSSLQEHDLSTTAAVSTRSSLAGWKDALAPEDSSDATPRRDVRAGRHVTPTAPDDSVSPPSDTPRAASGEVAEHANTSSDRGRPDRGWGQASEAKPAPTPLRRPLDRSGPRIVAVANQKGGVGKTTTTVNLGAAVAELGHRVLIVDLDPQGNASTGLGINPRSLEASMYDVLLHDVPLDDAIEAAAVRNLFVAPANLDLAGAEIELVPAFSREMRLKNAINSVADDFDLVLIDCPPSLGLLTVNAFAAASEVLVPIQCEYYALEGLGQLLRNIDLVKRNLNASLELGAIVLVMYDARTNLAAQVASEVREHFGSKVCRSVIPRTVRLSEAPSFGQPITVFDPTSRGALAYRDLAMEVVGEPS